MSLYELNKICDADLYVVYNFAWLCVDSLDVAMQAVIEISRIELKILNGETIILAYSKEVNNA